MSHKAPVPDGRASRLREPQGLSVPRKSSWLTSAAPAKAQGGFLSRELTLLGRGPLPEEDPGMIKVFSISNGSRLVLGVNTGSIRENNSCWLAEMRPGRSRQQRAGVGGVSVSSSTCAHQ